MNHEEQIDYFKIAVIGAPKTGKSSLVKQFISPDLFIFSKTDYIPTNEFEFHRKNIYLDGKFLRILIFDTPGVDQMRSINTVSYTISSGFIAVYEVCDAESFDSLPVYFENAKKYARGNIKIILIGINNDLMDEREVSYDRAKAWAEEVNVPYYEVNVSDHLQVEYIFITLVSMLLNDKLSGVENLKLKKQRNVMIPIPHRHKCILI